MITKIEILHCWMLVVHAENPKTGHKDNTCVTINFPNAPEVLIRRISKACLEIEDRVMNP